MRKIATILSCVFVLGAAFAIAADVDVSGTWKMTTKSQRGERTFDAVLTQAGEKLTVKTKDREGNDVTSEGTVKGAEISWETKRQTPMGEMLITYKGKIDGDKMSGTSQFGEMGSGEWTAEKAK